MPGEGPHHRKPYLNLVEPPLEGDEWLEVADPDASLRERVRVWVRGIIVRALERFITDDLFLGTDGRVHSDPARKLGRYETELVCVINVHAESLKKAIPEGRSSHCINLKKQGNAFNHFDDAGMFIHHYKGRISITLHISHFKNGGATSLDELTYRMFNDKQAQSAMSVIENRIKAFLALH